MAAFTTADAAERLASKQTAKQLGVSIGVGSGIKAKIKKPNLLQSAVQGLGTVYDYAKNQPGTQSTNPINTGAGVSMGAIANPIQSTVEPTRLALRRAVGDITAIPGVGQPSASPTATDIRSGNWAAPVVDYASLAVELLPGSIPAYKEVKRSLSETMAKMLKQLPSPKIPMATASPLTQNEYLQLMQRGRNLRFRQDQYPELFASAKNYWGQDFPQFQNYLRDPNEIVPFLTTKELMNLKTDIKQIDELFKKAPALEKPVVVYRGVKRAWNNNNSEFMKMLDNLEPGDVFSEPGYSSTTINLEMGQGFADRGLGGYVLEIEMPKGSKAISPLHGWPQKPLRLDPESEILLPRNSRFQLVERNGETLRVRLVS